jgi:hypothetical protein
MWTEMDAFRFQLESPKSIVAAVSQGLRTGHPSSIFAWLERKIKP